MIGVQAASRLHFGMLSLPAPGEPSWANADGEPLVPARRFGGAGLMVEAPGLRLSAGRAAAWSAEGPLAERALEFARRFAESLGPESLPPHRLVVEQAPPEHGGLGTGTQLGLSVARALARSAGHVDWGAAELARRVGRGLRSAVGVHGFERGGFLVDAGKGAADTVAPLAAGTPFPDEWRVVLVLPSWPPGIHGGEEQGAFRRLGGGAETDALCRLVLLGMLPALAERDLTAFGEAVYDFNARSGESFAAAQGGRYAGAAAEVVEFVRRQGVRGVGQSSWGPALFAVTGDAERAEDLASRVRARFALAPGEVVCTRAWNHGAVLP